MCDHPVISLAKVRLQLHGAIYRPDSFVMMLRYCSNLKVIRYESTSLNKIMADKSHRVIVAQADRLGHNICTVACILHVYAQGVDVYLARD